MTAAEERQDAANRERRASKLVAESERLHEQLLDMTSKLDDFVDKLRGEVDGKGAQ